VFTLEVYFVHQRWTWIWWTTATRSFSRIPPEIPQIPRWNFRFF